MVSFLDLRNKTEINKPHFKGQKREEQSERCPSFAVRAAKRCSGAGRKLNSVITPSSPLAHPGPLRPCFTAPALLSVLSRAVDSRCRRQGQSFYRALAPASLTLPWIPAGHREAKPGGDESLQLIGAGQVKRSLCEVSEPLIYHSRPPGQLKNEVWRARGQQEEESLIFSGFAGASSERGGDGAGRGWGYPGQIPAGVALQLPEPAKKTGWGKNRAVQTTK